MADVVLPMALAKTVCLRKEVFSRQSIVDLLFLPDSVLEVLMGYYYTGPQQRVR
jgi:hypothetical protein